MAKYPSVSGYFQITAEATEGTSQVGASGVTSYALPGRGDNYLSVAKKALLTVLPSNVGHGRVWRVVNPMSEVVGNLNTWLFPTKGATPLLAWPLTLAGTPLNLTAYTVDKYTPNENYERFLGVKVESLEIAAAANSPDAQPVTLAYALRGMSKAADPGSLTEGSYDAEDPYVFSRGTFTVDTADTTVRSFTLSIANTLAAGRCTGTTALYHQWAGRQVRGRFMLDFDDVALIDKYEAGTHVTCSLTFTHPNGASADLSLDLQTDAALMNVTKGEPLGDVATLDVELLPCMVSNVDLSFSIS